MAITLADQYYIKAIDEYPYNLEESIENLNYALSYDPDHVGALYLMGRLFMEYLDEWNTAEEYFQKAISIDPTNYKVNCTYAKLLITFREYEKAEKLIQFTRSLRGNDPTRILFVEAFLYEHQGRLAEAVEILETAKNYAFTDSVIDEIEADLNRVQKKIKNKQPLNWINR